MHSERGGGPGAGSVLADTHLKSGMPLAVLIPAPATTTTFLQRPCFTSWATGGRPPGARRLTLSLTGESERELQDWVAGWGSLDMSPSLVGKLSKTPKRIH